MPAWLGQAVRDRNACAPQARQQRRSAHRAVAAAVGEAVVEVGGDRLQRCFRRVVAHVGAPPHQLGQQADRDVRGAARHRCHAGIQQGGVCTVRQPRQRVYRHAQQARLVGAGATAGGGAIHQRRQPLRRRVQQRQRRLHARVRQRPQQLAQLFRGAVAQASTRRGQQARQQRRRRLHPQLGGSKRQRGNRVRLACALVPRLLRLAALLRLLLPRLLLLRLLLVLLRRRRRRRPRQQRRQAIACRPEEGIVCKPKLAEAPGGVGQGLEQSRVPCSALLLPARQPSRRRVRRGLHRRCRPAGWLGPGLALSQGLHEAGAHRRQQLLAGVVLQRGKRPQQHGQALQAERLPRCQAAPRGPPLLLGRQQAGTLRAARGHRGQQRGAILRVPCRRGVAQAGRWAGTQSGVASSTARQEVSSAAGPCTRGSWAASTPAQRSTAQHSVAHRRARAAAWQAAAGVHPQPAKAPHHHRHSLRQLSTGSQLSMPRRPHPKAQCQPLRGVAGSRGRQRKGKGGRRYAASHTCGLYRSRLAARCSAAASSSSCGVNCC